MLSFLSAHATTAAAASACVFAWWKGGRAERAGALLIGGGWILSMVAFYVGAITRSAYAPYVPFAVDALVAVGFLGLALRYSSAWLGVAVLLQAAELALHAAFLTGDGSGMALYFARVNLLGLAIIVLFLGATLNVWFRRKGAAPAVSATPTAAGLGQGGDGFPRKAFDAAPVPVTHRLVRR